jgi:hypothetical protein
MTLNQLFLIKPSLELILQLLACVNINSLKSDVSFSKKTIVRHDIIAKAEPVINELRKCYLPCKTRRHLDNMTPMKLITVLKQCLKLYNISLYSYEKYINSEKTILYKLDLRKPEEKTEGPPNTNEIKYAKCLLSFD